MRMIGALLLFLGCTGPALAQVPLDPATMQPSEIEGLQRRLTGAKCYADAIDGRPSEALTKAIGACPDQRPVLRVETGMHVAHVLRIAADAQCRVLATSSFDKTVRLWAMPEGRLMRTQRLPIGSGFYGQVTAVAVSPDGSFIVAGGSDAAYAINERVSAYIFDTATGTQIRRVGAFFQAGIKHLALSPDGQRLAVALAFGHGISVLEVASGRELMIDRDFGGKDVYGVTFGPDGALYAVGNDSTLRRYGPDLRPAVRIRTAGGKLPYTVAADPTGRRLAIGYGDSINVDFYDANSLRRLGAADTKGADAKGLDRMSLEGLAWSRDGQRLFAGGNFWIGGHPKSRIFNAEGSRVGADIETADIPVSALSTCGDAAAFAASSHALGLVRPDGTTTTFAQGHTADMVGKLGAGFTVSPDGRRVRFGLEPGDETPVLFDLAQASLGDAPDTVPGLAEPDTTGLAVTRWKNDYTPRLGSRSITLLPHEQARSLAVRPDHSGFVLGTNFGLRAYDAVGKERWPALSENENAPGVNLARGGELIVVAYGDGTIRWHRWSDGAELLALFVNKDTKQWVAWTPTGYYKASAGGEDMIGWHVNRGWEQPADFFPASKFRDTYARADIVDRVLDTLDEAEAIRQANATRPDKGAAKPITDLLPPVVAILSPAEGATMSGEEVRIDYLVRSPAGLPVDAVEALVDGRPASRERGLGRPDGNAVSALRECLTGTRGLGRAEGGGLQGCRGSLTVRLPPGAREIGLFARTGDRAGDVAKIRIVRDAGATADAEGTKPKLYALVVGISAYANADYTLQYAAKDARDFAAALQNQTGGVYADVIVRRLTDGEATHNGVLDGLEWLTKQVTVRDVGLVYLAGHGVLDDRDRFYFVAADSDIDRLRATGVPREDIQDALDALPGKALLFLDACHAGAVGLSKVRRESVDINGVANEFSRTERGLVMFTASTGKQVSQENAAWGNGAFTKAVIEGLGTPGQRGKADLLGKGTISTSALDVYVSERVKELTGGKQSPVMIRPSTVPDFTLAAVR